MQQLNLTNPPTLRPHGQRVGNLTRFGETWINLNSIEALEFGPEDGCGCEIAFKETDESFHVTLEDAAALRAYLTGFESIQLSVDAPIDYRVTIDS